MAKVEQGAQAAGFRSSAATIRALAATLVAIACNRSGTRRRAAPARWPAQAKNPASSIIRI